MVFHSAPLGAWSSISALGLRTAAQLAAESGHGRLTALRSAPLELLSDGDWPMRLSDQRASLRANIEAHLDGMNLLDWLGLVNSRVFFWTRQKELNTMLSRAQSEGQDLLVIDTAKLIHSLSDRVEVTIGSSGAPDSWASCPCRGSGTFATVDSFDGPVGDVEEISVVDGVDDVAAYVSRVVRYHPGRGTEVLVG